MWLVEPGSKRMHQPLNHQLTSPARVPATRLQFRFRLQAEANNSSHVFGLPSCAGHLEYTACCILAPHSPASGQEPRPGRARGLAQGRTADPGKELEFGCGLAQLQDARLLGPSLAHTAHESMPGPRRAGFLFVENS